VAELFAGARNDAERKALDRFLSSFRIVAVDGPIARAGGAIRQEFGRKHGTDLPDALIAASAAAVDATLVTFNERHFPMLTRVLVPYAAR